MSKKLPSLNAIRFFESAARHLSFTRAGDELHVTQGAVSRQIKLLEEQLDCRLFARKGPQLRLTAHGEKLRETVAVALGILKQGVANLQRSAKQVLTVSVLPSFANYWLIPKLTEFERLHPSFSILLASSYSMIDFAVNTDIDVGIRLGQGNWPGLYCHQINNDTMFPACTPQLAQEISSIDDILEHTIILDTKPFDEWANWFKSLDLPYEPRSVKEYDDTGTQIKAALEGQGISLVRAELVQDHLDSGLLVRLFDVEYRSSLHYYFVCPEQRMAESTIRIFHDWITGVSPA